MIKQFKLYNPINYSIIFIVMLALWAYRFIFAPTPIESYNLENLIMSAQFENYYYKLLSPLLAFVILYISAIALIKINSDLIIIENGYQMPGLLLAMFSGFYINSQRFFISTLAGILLFLSLCTVCYADKQDKRFSGCFNAGVLFILSVLLYPKLIIFLPLLFITLIIIKSANWREFIIILLGIVSPLFILFSLSYLYGDINYIWEKLYLNFSHTFLSTKYDIFFLISIVPILVWGIISIFSKLLIPDKLSAYTRNLQLLIVIYLLSFSVYFLSPFSENESITIIFAPISLLLSKLFINAKNKMTILFFSIFILNIILSQILQIIFYQSIF